MSEQMPDFLKVLARTPGYFVSRVTGEEREKHGLSHGWTVCFNLSEWWHEAANRCACTCGTDFPFPCECHPFRVAEVDRVEADEAFKAL